MTTEKIMFDDREAWLTEASNLILDDLIMNQCPGFERPSFRISIGFPKHSRGGRAIAVCFKKEASSDGVNEIFINPEIDDAVQVLESVAHELIHAVDNCESGHRNFFARVARAIGLDGKFTATFAGADLKGVLESYSVLLGKFPHQKMQMAAVHKKDGTRQLKVECTS
ncbi:MAG TPA: hypothetical protein VMW50_01865, partial [Dehalococcoidia bacterium]|nr:hypothetical protein [Dehalococcoidia bacterium]